MAARAGLCCATAICRGAVLTAGSLRPRGDRLRVFVDFPEVEIAVAVAGAARRLGIAGRLRPTDDGGERLRIPDGPALLQHLGAITTLAAWHQRDTPIAVTGPDTNRFTQANAQRIRTAAAHVSARVSAALQQLGYNVPPDLAHAGQLRLRHGTASLTELGALSDPPVSKDTIAGRLRRLLQLAEHHTTNR
ncbi:MAG: cell division protein WhiA [Actinoplanes sp.]|nr:cell division protein WhiA [Actinoplanes sp.]